MKRGRQAGVFPVHHAVQNQRGVWRIGEEVEVEICTRKPQRGLVRKKENILGTGAFRSDGSRNFLAGCEAFQLCHPPKVVAKAVNITFMLSAMFLHPMFCQCKCCPLMAQNMCCLAVFRQRLWVLHSSGISGHKQQCL